MTTQTIVPTAPIATREPPRAPLLARLVERVVRLRWSHQSSIDSTLNRAIEEAFESLARESRN